jgi:anti-sigma factor RsiW
MSQKTIIKEHLTCRKVEEFLMAYLDHELSLFSRLRFKYHLMICSDCTNYMEEYKNSITLGKRVFESPDDIATGNVPDEILHAIMHVKKLSG